MLRYLLNPKYPTPLNRKQTGCEQKSDPHNRVREQSLSAAWVRNRLNLLLREAAQSAPCRPPITPAPPAAQAPCLCGNGQRCIIRMSSWTAGLLRVGAQSPARAWKWANTFRSRRLFNFHLLIIIACLMRNARQG